MNDSGVRKAESRAVRHNPDGAVAPALALQTVVLFTISDAFGLVPEEIIWAEDHLGKIFEPLLEKKPTSVPLAVRQEMLDANYRDAVERTIARDDRRATPAYDPTVTHASVNDWAAVLMQLVTACYRLRPMDESTMFGRLVGLLRELGVGDPANPRASRYLPNDVRHRLNDKAH